MSHKKRWAAIGIIILLGIASLAVALIIIPLTHKSSSTVPQEQPVSSLPPMEVCSKKLILEASGPLEESDQVALGVVVEKITALKDFDRDPNCLYITLQYAIAAGDAVTSQDYYSKLERVYTQAVGFGNAFTVSLAPITTLRKNVDFLIEDAKNDAGEQDKTTAEGSAAADKFQEEQK